MRRFLLLRHRDVSGVSGTGIVAEGVEFSDRSVSMRWHGDHASTSVFETGVQAIVAVHGHGGATEILYADPSPDPQRVPTSTPNERIDRLCDTCGGAWPCTRCQPREHQSERTADP